MQTKYLCVLIHIWTKGEIGAPLTSISPPVKYFTHRSKAVHLLWIFYVFFFCLLFAMPLYASVYMCLVVTCWERADLLALVCGVLLWVCYFPIGILGQVWYLIVSIPDLCTLTYFAQGPQCSDAGEAQTSDPSVSSQALCHWATTLLIEQVDLSNIQ